MRLFLSPLELVSGSLFFLFLGREKSWEQGERKSCNSSKVVAEKTRKNPSVLSITNSDALSLSSGSEAVKLG